MKPALATLLGLCLALHLLAEDPDEERYLHPKFATVPPPAQLVPGKAPGTFHVEATCTVDFSRQPDFPATIVLLDYAKKEVARQTVISPKPFTLSYDLKPGTYEAVSKPYTETQYWDAPGFTVHIDAHGTLTNTWSHSFESPTFWHVRRIEILSPKNMETIRGKTIVLGSGSDAETVISDDHLVLKWKAVPGVKEYTVRMWPIDPRHPDSAFGDWDGGGTVKTNELHLTKDDFLHLKTGYLWVVTDGSEEVDRPYEDGHIARGESIFLTSGATEAFSSQADRAEDGDQWVCSQFSIRFRQGDRPSDDPTSFILIDAVGSESPGIKAGLQPGLRLFSINGRPVRTLDDLRAILANLPRGSMMNLVAMDGTEKHTFHFVAN